MASPTPKPISKPKVKKNGNATTTIPTVALKEALQTGSAELQTLLRKIKTREAKVGIIGLGYVGLPLLRLYASKGFTVLGYDLDNTKIARIKKGESYIGG